MKQINLKFPGRWNAVINLTSLFISKIGGILVTLFFIPIYYSLFGAEQFSTIVVILSLQGLLVLLDFGMSTIVGRDIALLGKNSIQAITTWHNAEIILTFFYIILFITIIIIYEAFNLEWKLSTFTMGLIVVLFWSLIINNLGQTALLSGKLFKTASGLQFIGSLTRAVTTTVSLEYFGVTISVFIISQLIITIMQLLITRWICKNILFESITIKRKINECVELLKHGKSLLVISLAGAATMQLDRPIMSLFVPSEQVSYYFLAITFCMTPISVLATPISQYFQPHYISLSNSKNANRELFKFVSILTLITGIPSIILWFYLPVFIELWLGSTSSISQVITYATILLPGITIGALGYIPFTLLLPQQDYKFQAYLATALALTTLAFITYYSNQQNIYAICWTYAIYHSASTILLWMRAIFLKSTRNHAKYALSFTIQLSILLLLLLLLLLFLN